MNLDRSHPLVLQAIPIMMPEVVGGNSETRVFRKASCYIKKKKKKAGKGLFSNLFQIPSQFEIRRKANAFESSCMFVMLVMQ